MLRLLVLCVILLKEVNCESVAADYDDYIDPIINLLLNGNDSDNLELYDDIGDELSIGEEIIFSNGTWKCGSCNNVDESKLLYSEVNSLTSNISDDNVLQVQVGVSLEEMRCVTISSNDVFKVKKISGSCSGPTLTLSVADAEDFVVRVYGG